MNCLRAPFSPKAVPSLELRGIPKEHDIQFLYVVGTPYNFSTCNFFLCKLSWVGKTLEQALYRKFLTFGGVLSAHTDFQTHPFVPAMEWSPPGGLSSLCATPCAILTVNLWALFSFQMSTSLPCRLFKGIRKMSSHVCLSNQYASFAL